MLIMHVILKNIYSIKIMYSYVYSLKINLNFQVKTRSVAELVHFYYFWKKSDRHDQFERKQVSMRPEMK